MRCGLAKLGKPLAPGEPGGLTRIAATATTRRGKRPALIDLRSEAGREALWQRTEDAPVVALWRQQLEGGSWHAQGSLAQTGQWRRGLGHVAHGLRAGKPDLPPWLADQGSGFGLLRALRPSVHRVRTPAGCARPSVPPRTDAPDW